MYCHHCGKYYYSSMRCPDCPTLLTSRRRLTPDLTLEKMVMYFEYHGWKDVGSDVSTDLNLRKLIHMQSAAPLIRVGLSGYEENIPRYLMAAIHICNLKEHPEIRQPYRIALKLPCYDSSTKFYILTNKELVAMLSYPLFSGILVDELIYVLECELGLLMCIINERLAIELTPGIILTQVFD